MPPLYFEDVDVGFRFETPRRTVTEADLVAFAGVSGDFNPLHTDSLFASQSIYGERIAHGALVLSLATGLRQRAGLFDGTLMGLLEIRGWRFTTPVRIGDTIRVMNEITELQETSKPDRGIMVQHVDVLNQDDTVVQSGEFVLLLRRRAGRA
ncbi:MAG: MaoC family dehydratase N-terminal domain-containing protein [Actinomycetota bacterium]|nr:MaoC family dehydratase N-terminal domain-containing protein [Actinomycetota bacterium]